MRFRPHGVPATLAICMLAGCRAFYPTHHVDEACVETCEQELSQCTQVECQRGCTLMLDRTRENQTQSVLACMKAERSCSDAKFASCAVRVGPFADGGGLEVPKPPEEDP